MGPEYRELQDLVKSEGLHTVCQEAGCPNIYECWEDREATFLIGGDQCTRRCDFCQIDTGKPQPLDRDEPRRVAESVQTMGLRYATITGVARDDLPDGGAWLYAETVRADPRAEPRHRRREPDPRLQRRARPAGRGLRLRPEVLAHNVETVPRIFKRIRPAFRYDRSLDVLTQARAAGLVTKSNLILGMGETREEVTQALRDLHDAGCELVTITQYLRPTLRHHPVERWVKPEEFVELAAEAEEIGFAGVMSGPLVRSSYRAGRLYRQAMDRRAPTGRLRLTRIARTTGTAAAARQPRLAKADEDGPDPAVRQTYRLTKQSDRRIGCDPARLVRRRRPRSASALLCLLMPRSGGWSFADHLRRPLRPLAPRCSSSVAGPSARVRPDGGAAGAAAAALRMLSRGGRPTQPIAFNKQQDVVHRVVGPPGIVLVGEGNPNRLKALMATERRKHERVAVRVPDPRGDLRQRRGRGAAAASWSATSRR